MKLGMDGSFKCLPEWVKPRAVEGEESEAEGAAGYAMTVLHLALNSEALWGCHLHHKRDGGLNGQQRAC
ncbi:hypothetical protein J6590_001565 [Homalodisca vitripennis]|nr:hypothetical protein J6590_001565 [Homalodisca vitripennis]